MKRKWRKFTVVDGKEVTIEFVLKESKDEFEAITAKAYYKDTIIAETNPITSQTLVSAEINAKIKQYFKDNNEVG